MEIQERTLGREGQALRRDLDEAFDVFAQSVMATAMALEVISVVMPGRSIAVIGGPSSILRSYLVRKIVLSGADVRFVVLPGEADVVPEKPYLLTSQFYRKLCMLHGRANQGLLCLPYNELERHVDLLSSATLVVGAVHVFPPDIHGKVAAVCEGGTGRAIALSQNAPQYPLLGPAKLGNAKEQGPFLRFASQYLDGFVSQLGTRYVQRVSDAGFEVSTNLRILRND